MWSFLFISNHLQASGWELTRGAEERTLTSNVTNQREQLFAFPQGRMPTTQGRNSQNSSELPEL